METVHVFRGDSNHFAMFPDWLRKICFILFLLFSSICHVISQHEVLKRGGNGKPRADSARQRRSLASNPVGLQTGNLVMGVPTSSSITASVVLNDGAEAYVEYSLDSQKLDRKTRTFAGESNRPVEISISNLRASSRYFYRLAYRLPSADDFHYSGISWFSTQKDKETTFSFGVQGDSHPERTGKMFNPVLYRRNFENVSIRKPDFYFLMGDDFNIDRFISAPKENAWQIEQAYVRQRAFVGMIGLNPPLFLVNGNHEQTARYLLDGTPHSAPVIAAHARDKYFPMPVPGKFYSGDRKVVDNIGLLKDYYAFEWGNALFVVIDPYWHSEIAVDGKPSEQGGKAKRDQWGITIGNEQYDWLKKTLEGSRAKFKFVFAHHVNGTGRGGVERARYFEWGGYGQNNEWQFDKYRSGWALPIHQLFVKNHVTIFFQGHDHLFAKQELDGVIYQTVPNPADDTHTAFNREAYSVGEILPNSGFLHVTVSANETTVEYVRAYLGGDGLPGDAVAKNHVYSVRKQARE